jgi:hypothetical protein
MIYSIDDICDELTKTKEKKTWMIHISHAGVNKCMKWKMNIKSYVDWIQRREKDMGNEFADSY